jgi:hypothetical protein
MRRGVVGVPQLGSSHFGLMHLGANTVEIRSSPTGRRGFGLAFPGLRCASPWAIFVFSLREMRPPWERIQERECWAVFVFSLREMRPPTERIQERIQERESWAIFVFSLREMRQALLRDIGFEPFQFFAQLDVAVPGVLGQAVAFAWKDEKAVRNAQRR